MRLMAVGCSYDAAHLSLHKEPSKLGKKNVHTLFCNCYESRLKDAHVFFFNPELLLGEDTMITRRIK